ncbi:MAG: signal peptidase I [Desulfovibrio sp.]|nr:signal peptidase I [Desulfovibrio sp.]
MKDDTTSLGQKKEKPLWREYGEALLVALGLALVIRTFAFQAFKIPSESMLDTLLVGDHLLGTKFDYGLKIPFTDISLYKGGDPQRGDIVIFEYPEDPSVDFIKRIVGVPGDVLEMRGKQFFRNGQPVKEDYIRFADPEGIQAPRDNYGPITVPQDKYFVMGDNRDNSMDSRFWGCVDRSAIVAKAWRIYWSWGGIRDIRWGRIGRAIR